MSRTQNLCPQQMLRSRANGKTLSATICPQQCVLVYQALKYLTILLVRAREAQAVISMFVSGSFRNTKQNKWLWAIDFYQRIHFPWRFFLQNCEENVACKVKKDRRSEWGWMALKMLLSDIWTLSDNSCKLGSISGRIKCHQTLLYKNRVTRVYSG